MQRFVVGDLVVDAELFRGDGKEIIDTPDRTRGLLAGYTPLPTVTGSPELNRVLTMGIHALVSEQLSQFEKAATFLFGALQQFFIEVSKRTSRLMMSGNLPSRCQQYWAHEIRQPSYCLSIIFG